MFLRSEIPFLKTLDVGFVKGLELQGPPLGDVGVGASVTTSVATKKNREGTL
jgi:hypothetical protein